MAYAAQTGILRGNNTQAIGSSRVKGSCMLGLRLRNLVLSPNLLSVHRGYPCTFMHVLNVGVPTFQAK